MEKDIEYSKIFKIEISNEEAKEILKSVLNRIEVKGAELYVVKQAIKQVLKENKQLKEYIAIAPNLDEMTAIKYRNIQQDAYIQGRADEQQKAEQIIHENYILKQKIKDKIIERQFELQQEYKDFENDSILLALKELLESEGM